MFPIFYSVFAGTTVVANFLVMCVWTPACLIVNDHLPSAVKFPKLPDLRTPLTTAILKFRWIWVSLFTAISLLSISVLFYSTTWVFPDSPGLQLFDSSHPFEQYDNIYRNRFWFDRVLRVSHFHS